MTTPDELRAVIAALVDQESGYELVDLGDGGYLVSVAVEADVAELIDGNLPIEVRAAEGGPVTLSTPLATLAEPSRELLESLMRRHWYGQQTGGLSYAVVDFGDRDVLAAVLHWPLRSLAPEQFAELVDVFVLGALDCLEEVANLATADYSVAPVHPG